VVLDCLLKLDPLDAHLLNKIHEIVLLTEVQEDAEMYWKVISENKIIE
jgi:hypothetical protein